MSAPAIGIDLGTTYSCVAVFQDGKVNIIPNEQGRRTTPSYVAFTDEEIIVGDAAKSQAAFNPENTVFDAKRLIGRRYDDSTIQGHLANWPFYVLNEDGKPKICAKLRGEKKLFDPEEIGAMVLSKMKESAEMYLGTKVTDAVITVPAYFNDAQRQATKEASKIAGLNVLQIIDDPTAVALAYKSKTNVEGENVLMFDLGGGTLDVSLLSIKEGHLFDVKSTAGDTGLGGEDFDNRLVDYCVEEFKKKYNEDLRSDYRAMRRLRTSCEKNKRNLSSCTSVNIEIEALFKGLDFTMNITRSRFEDLCSDLFRSTLEPVEKALIDSNLNKNEIDTIVIVGGSTRIPKVQKLLQDFFNGKNLCMSINPDEAVAYGAAIQAAVLSGNKDEMIEDFPIADVVPLSLGLRVSTGSMFIMIKRNTKVPCKVSKILENEYDDITYATIAIFEGEHTMVLDNHFLCCFTVRWTEPAPKNSKKFYVTFDVDANGILNVSVTEMQTLIMKSVAIFPFRISKRSPLPDALILRMQKEVEEYATQEAKQYATQYAKLYASQDAKQYATQDAKQYATQDAKPRETRYQKFFRKLCLFFQR